MNNNKTSGMSLLKILAELEQNLFLPQQLISCLQDENGLYRCKVRYHVISDAAMLNCGCVVSESLVNEIKEYIHSQEIPCPVCNEQSCVFVGPVKPLRNLYVQLQFFKDTDHQQQQEQITSTVSNGTITDQRNPDENRQQSLLSLFHSMASKLSATSIQEKNATTEEGSYDTDNISTNRTVPIQDENSLVEPLNVTQSTNNLQHVTQFDEEKEFYFAKCFPIYRKRTQYNTHSKFLRAKSKLFINTSISPDCTKFALITEHKWEVYAIPNSSSRGSKGSGSVEPELLCCGKSSGEHGPSFDSLKLPKDPSVLYPIYNESYEYSAFDSSAGNSNKNPNFSNPKNSISNWEHLYCKLANDLLIISGTKGLFRVFDLQQSGKLIYTYRSSFPIRCIDIDPQGTVVACGITGKDRTNGAGQALILFHRIERVNDEKHTEKRKNSHISHREVDSGMDSSQSTHSFNSSSTSLFSENISIRFPPPVTITLPYRDPINTLQFSSDGQYLSCSTALESRFLVISLRKINEPRLVMKSLRSIDTSLESEGITDTKIFPGNPNLMCVTSVAFNAPPIVINTKIQSINGVQTVAQPTMLLRLDELGSKIHKCEISPRNDSIAFLDRNGTVHIMFAPTMMDNEKRRIVAVDVVANAYRMREAATLKFSNDGHKLYLLDRKGILYVEDFAYGLPQNHEVTKCKQIN